MPADDSHCLVYVFRDQFVLLYSNTVKVEGVTYAKLLDESYTKFNLTSGEKEVNIRWFPLSGGVNLDIKIECLPNKTYYVTIGGTYNYGYPTATRIISAREITKEEAENRIKTYKN